MVYNVETKVWVLDDNDSGTHARDFGNCTLTQKTETNPAYKNNYYLIFKSEYEIVSFPDNPNSEDNLKLISNVFEVATVTYTYPIAVPTEDTPSYIEKLNAKIAALEAENATLKEAINNTLRPKYPWHEVPEYADYTERLEFMSNYNNVMQHIYYTYNSSTSELFIYTTNAPQYCSGTEFLCIICTYDRTCFFRINYIEKICYKDQEHAGYLYANLNYRIPNYALPFTNSTPDEKRAFDYVFMKKK